VDDRVCPSEGCLILAGEISFAGGVLGIMVGGQVAPERWSPHALPSVPAVSAGPVSLAIGASSRGASLRMTLRF
jgi:hypothetical protein